MLVKILFIVLALTLVEAHQDMDEEKLLETLVTLLDDEEFQELFDSDIDDEDLFDEIQKVLGDDLSEKMADGFFTGLKGLLSSDNKAKWAPVNFAKQISCYQGRSTNVFLAALYAYRKYNGYGCYCGGGHYEGNYLDATDECCKYHDACYERVQHKYGLSQGCHTYTTTYKVECCTDKKISKCTDTGPSAGRALCECDQKMAKCVAKHSALSTYNKSYMKNRSQCRSTSSQTKVYSLWDIIKSCKHAFRARKKFPQTFPSQGKCPAKKGWWWGRR